MKIIGQLCTIENCVPRETSAMLSNGVTKKDRKNPRACKSSRAFFDQL